MEYRLTVSMLQNERWWGGTSFDGARSPFNGNSVFSRDLLHSGLNQTMPMYISDLGRCIWSEEPFAISFDKGKIIISGRSEVVLEQFGNSLKEAYLGAMNKHFPPEGDKPNEKFFKYPQYNTWMQLVYDQTQEGILEYARGIVGHGFQPGIFIIDEGWQKDYGVWEFDEHRFPEPKKTIDELHAMGFIVMLWVVPNVRSDGRWFVCHTSKEFCPKMYDKYFLRTESGAPAIMQWWNGYSAVFDMTKEGDRALMKSQLDRLRSEFGVDGFKFDGGSLAFYAKNSAGGEKTDASAKAAERNLAWNDFGTQYSFHEFKDTFKGGGKRVIQRMLDRNHSWDNQGLNTLVPGAILQGLLGHPFICPDMIGGGQWEDRALGKPIDQELFVRMAQCSALFPMMRFSRAPWEVLDNEHLTLVKKAHDLHCEFSGVILELVEEACRNGEPILRSLEYNYSHSGYADISDVFMLGEDILVAPVLKKGESTRTVPLPRGKWAGFDGKVYEGGQTVSIPVTLADLPYFRRYV